MTKIDLLFDSEGFLPYSVNPLECSREYVLERIAEAPGSTKPGDYARILTRLLWRRYRHDRDCSWLALLKALDDVLGAYYENDDPSSHRVGKRANIRRYWEWRKTWFAEKLRTLRVRTAAAVMSRAERYALRQRYFNARLRSARKAEPFRLRLIADALARWEAGKESADGRTHLAAQRARREALDLGWEPGYD